MRGEEGSTVQLPVNKTVDVAEVRPDPRWKTYAEVYRTSGRYAPSVPNWTPIRQASAETLNALMADCSLDADVELRELDEKLARILKEQGIAG